MPTKDKQDAKQVTFTKDKDTLRHVRFTTQDGPVTGSLYVAKTDSRSKQDTLTVEVAA